MSTTITVKVKTMQFEYMGHVLEFSREDVQRSMSNGARVHSINLHDKEQMDVIFDLVVAFLERYLPVTKIHKLGLMSDEQLASLFRPTSHRIEMNTDLPFSWLSTRQVCQRWSAYFATSTFTQG